MITTTTPQVYRVAEFESVDIPIDLLFSNGQLDLSGNLQYQNYFSIEIGRSGVSIRARGLVGIIPVNKRISLEVVPRFSVNNLARLVEVSKEPIQNVRWFRRGYRAQGGLFPSLIEIYADALYGHILEIQSRGFLRQYREEVDLSGNPHGRILVDRSIKRLIATGVVNKAEFTWFQRTIDIPANRCLLHAISYLSRLNTSLLASTPASPAQRVAIQLNYCSQVLSGVSVDQSMSFLRDPIVVGRQSLPSQRTYYRPALELAKTILGTLAVDLVSLSGPTELPSLLLNLPSVFERYVRNTLINGLATSLSDHSALDGNLPTPTGARRPSLFDNGNSYPANPDIVIMNSRDICAAIVEVKYKPALGQQPMRDDLEQTLVYGMAYRAPLAIVVQPVMSGQQSGCYDLGSFRGMQVALYLIDLSSDLEKQEDLLIAEVLRRVTANDPVSAS